MAEGNGSPGTFRSGRDLFMAPQSDRLNDQFRLIDTLVLSMTDSWAYLPPRARHILWLKLASCDTNFLEQCGMPLENGILLHWSMWPDDLGDYAQAVSLRSSRQQLEYLEPKNVAMASAMRQAEMAESTARIQIQLAQLLLQLSRNGADTTELAKLFSKNKFDKESIRTVLANATQAMQENHSRAPVPEPVPVGICSECNVECEYVRGEDAQGQFVIDICATCYEEHLQAEGISEGEPTYNEEDIAGLLESLDDGALVEDEMISLSQRFAEAQEASQNTEEE